MNKQIKDLPNESVNLTDNTKIPVQLEDNTTGYALKSDLIGNPNLPEQNLTVELMTVGNILFNPVYDNGVDGVGATLTATGFGVLRDTSGTAKIDGVTTPIEGTIIWIKNRTNAIENGAYEITVRGDGSTFYVLTRPEGYNETPELFPLQINVLFGSANKDSVWLQKTVNPVIGVNPIVVNKIGAVTQLLPIRFVDTATSETLPPYTFNPLTNIMTFNNVGYFGSMNGCDATLNSALPEGFRTFLVKDEVGENKKYNGTYRWINVGSSVIAPSAVRLDTNSSHFAKENRTFLVSNPYSHLYSKQYCVVPTTPPLSSTTFNTVPIEFVEFYARSLQEVSDAGGFANGSTIRQGSVTRFALNGIETVCSENKIIQFVDGREYYYSISGGTPQPIVHCNSMNIDDVPTTAFDVEDGFDIGSRYTVLNTGITYILTIEGWIPLGGQFQSDLTNPLGSIKAVTFDKAFYSVSNGMVDVVISGLIEVDFSTNPDGSFEFTLPPLADIGNVFGNIAFACPNQINGIILNSNEAKISSNDLTFVTSEVGFVAKFSYQAF